MDPFENLIHTMDPIFRKYDYNSLKLIHIPSRGLQILNHKAISIFTEQGREMKNYTIFFEKMINIMYTVVN